MIIFLLSIGPLLTQASTAVPSPVLPLPPLTQAQATSQYHNTTHTYNDALGVTNTQPTILGPTTSFILESAAQSTLDATATRLAQPIKYNAAPLSTLNQNLQAAKRRRANSKARDARCVASDTAAVATRKNELVLNHIGIILRCAVLRAGKSRLPFEVSNISSTSVVT